MLKRFVNLLLLVTGNTNTKEDPVVVLFDACLWTALFHDGDGSRIFFHAFSSLTNVFQDVFTFQFFVFTVAKKATVCQLMLNEIVLFDLISPS